MWRESTRFQERRVFVAGCPSCHHQPVLKAFTATYHAFNHQQTPEGKSITLFHVSSHTSVALLPPKKKLLCELNVANNSPDMLAQTKSETGLWKTMHTTDWRLE